MDVFYGILGSGALGLIVRECIRAYVTIRVAKIESRTKIELFRMKRKKK